MTEDSIKRVRGSQAGGGDAGRRLEIDGDESQVKRNPSLKLNLSFVESRKDIKLDICNSVNAFLAISKCYEWKKWKTA